MPARMTTATSVWEGDRASVRSFKEWPFIRSKPSTSCRLACRHWVSGTPHDAWFPFRNSERQLVGLAIHKPRFEDQPISCPAQQLENARTRGTQPHISGWYTENRKAPLTPRDALLWRHFEFQHTHRPTMHLLHNGAAFRIGTVHCTLQTVAAFFWLRAAGPLWRKDGHPHRSVLKKPNRLQIGRDAPRRLHDDMKD